MSGEPKLVSIAYLAIQKINNLFKENDTYYAKKIEQHDASINNVLHNIYNSSNLDSFQIYINDSENTDIKEAFINYHLDNYMNIFNDDKTGGKVRRKKRNTRKKTKKNSKHKKSKKGNKNKKRTRTRKR